MKQTKQTKKRRGNITTKSKKKGGNIAPKQKSKTIKANHQYKSNYFKKRMAENNIPILSGIRAFNRKVYTDKYLENMTDTDIKNVYDNFKLQSSSKVKHNRELRRSKKLNPKLPPLSIPKTNKKSNQLPYPFSPGRRSDEEEIQILERFNNESDDSPPYSTKINNNFEEEDLFNDDLFDDDIEH